MKNETDKVTKIFFILSILTLFFTYILSGIVAYKIYRPQVEDVSDIVSQMNLDSQELSISGYRIVNKEPSKYIASMEDANGQTYYVYNSPDTIATLILAVFLTILAVGVIAYLLLTYYRDYMRDTARKPVARLSETVSEILSGTSKEADLDRVLDEIKPLFEKNNLSKHRMEDSITKLFKAEKNRREFTANVTHELKTPLTSINGYAEMIASGFTNKEDTVKFANVILSEGNRLLNMIDEIIRLSQYESQDQEDMDYELIDLGEIVGQICYEMENYANTKRIDLSYSVQRVMVNADKSMIYEMITNLISNGIKYNNPPGTVKVTVRSASPFAQIIVKDDGIGISEENQERVFERFYMVNRNSKKSSGTGLGLSLVKHIVESHYGTIDLISKEGIGSEFIVSLPMRIGNENLPIEEN